MMEKSQFWVWIALPIDLEIKSKLGIVLDDGHFYEDLTLRKMKSLIASHVSLHGTIMHIRLYMKKV